MSGFTPGPWEVTVGTESNPSCLIEAEGQFIAQTVHDNDEANAHLIAAAPELYEAANHILAILDHETRSVTALDADKLRAALAKAEGKP